MKLKDGESARLADGRLVYYEKEPIGRKYMFCISSPVLGEPPTTYYSLSKDQAQRMLADEIKADVLETD